jgi:molecular chaperone IbpA
MRTTFDPASLWRSTIGFDRLFGLLDEAARLTGEEHYPPYNIERTGDNTYEICLALAGFTATDVTVTAEQNVLTIEGNKADKGDKGDHQYLYQGISARSFRRVFNLADYVTVRSANFRDGCLRIALVREVQEAMKPRRIAIGVDSDHHTIEHKQAA